MYELISNPGLRFELFELQGTLVYTFERDGKPAKQYVLSETDFEDTSSDGDSDAGRPLISRPGADASAVGISLRILKNEGLLCMTFRGEDGGSADWSFEGLNTKPILASATTQTYVNPDKCCTCERGHVTPDLMPDHYTQTDTVDSKDFGTQTDTTCAAEVSSTVEAGVQSNTRPGPVKSESHSVSTQTGSSTHPSTTKPSFNQIIPAGNSSQSPKRKAAPEPHAATPVHKRAKSKHDSPPWPQRIYMDCWREKPISRGDIGKLIIDLENATASYESNYGKHHARTTETKQIDLRAPDRTSHLVSIALQTH